jgi:hypothetical protein
MGYSMVMGPIWNKGTSTPGLTFTIDDPRLIRVTNTARVVAAQSKRPELGDGNAGTLKDEINDLVKNSATLAKDVYSAHYKA